MSSEINIRLKAELLGKSLQNLANEIEQELNSAIRDVANGAFAMINAHAQTELNSTRQDYLKGLNFEQIGDNSYLIVLEGDYPNALEDGFPEFPMREKMLKSEKIVSVGTRAGEKWVQKAEDGHKYAHVPFEQHPFAKMSNPSVKGSSYSDLNKAIQAISLKNRQGVTQKLTSIFKDDFGKPIQGKAARVESVEGFKNLSGLTKYQKTTINSSGKETTQSTYMTFRTISENGADWMHPGHGKLGFFEIAEKWADAEIDNILNRLLK